MIDAYSQQLLNDTVKNHSNELADIWALAWNLWLIENGLTRLQGSQFICNYDRTMLLMLGNSLSTHVL